MPKHGRLLVVDKEAVRLESNPVCHRKTVVPDVLTSSELIPMAVSQKVMNFAGKAPNPLQR